MVEIEIIFITINTYYYYLRQELLRSVVFIGL